MKLNQEFAKEDLAELKNRQPKSYYELLDWQKELTKAFGEDQAEDLVDDYLMEHPHLSMD